MKTTIETLTLIRDNIHSKCLPTARGKTEGKWETYIAGSGERCVLDKAGMSLASITKFSVEWEPESEANAAFIAATSGTAEPAWLCVEEEIKELLPMLCYSDLWKHMQPYATRRAASIINNWKGVIE